MKLKKSSIIWVSGCAEIHITFWIYSNSSIQIFCYIGNKQKLVLLKQFEKILSWIRYSPLPRSSQLIVQFPKSSLIPRLDGFSPPNSGNLLIFSAIILQEIYNTGRSSSLFRLSKIYQLGVWFYWILIDELRNGI